MSKVVDLSKAHAFWGLAKEGRLVMDDFKGATTVIACPTKWDAAFLRIEGEQPVKVYLVVEE